MSSQGLAQRALGGLKWVYLTQILARAVQPVTTVILARLLTPEDFGLVGMAMIAMGVLALVKDLGLGAAFIQRQTDQSDAANVVFWADLVLGGLWYVSLLLLAPWIALYFQQPIVTPILAVIGLNLVIHPFGAVQGLLLTKELLFRAIFVRDMAGIVLSAVVSIGFALNGYGVWSLAYGAVAGSLAQVLVMWLTHHWRPRFAFNFRVARDLLRFGRNTTLEGILGWLMSTIDNVFVGRFLGPAQLGVYRMGFLMAFAPTNYILGPLSAITYPVYCQLGERKDELRHGYLKTIRMISLIAFPSGVLLAIVAPDLIRTLMGERWMSAAAVTQIIALQGTLSALLLVAPQVYKALGRTEIMPRFYGVRMVFSIPAYYFAAQHGLISLCLTHLGLALLFMPINMHIALRVLDLSWGTLYTNIKAGLSIGAFSGAVVGGLILLLEQFPGVTGFIRLFMIIGVYTTASLLLVRIGHQETYAETRELCYRFLR